MGSERDSVDSLVAEQKAGLLRGTEEQANQQQQARRSLLEEAVHGVVGQVWGGDSEAKRGVERYSAEFIKSVPLFVGARWGTAAASAAFALDEVKTGDSLGMQAAEFGAGLAKGYLTKRTFDYLGGKQWNFAQKGMAMGSSARLLDAGLTPSMYVGADGHFDLAGGAHRAIANAGDAKALGADVLTFGVAHALPFAFGRSNVRMSGLLNNSLTGASFGFTSGALGELQREWHSGDDINYYNVLKAGGVEAGVMGLAAAAGYKLTPHERVASPIKQSEERQLSWATDGRAPKERAGYTAYFLTPEAIAKLPSPRWTPPEELHITELFGLHEGEGNQWAVERARQNPSVKVLGHAIDATGVEALHVSVDGKAERADGKPYHITRSLAEGRKAVESATVIEKAKAIEEARKTGVTADGITEADLKNLSYREFAPHEQFELNVQPRFEPSPTAEKQQKVREPKPEIPFDQLSPKLQVISALKNTPADYFSQLLSTRTPEHRAGSYFEMSPDELKAALYRQQWEPYNPVDAAGQPIIGGGAVGYRATMRGGRLGMAPIDALPEQAQLYMIDPKGIDNWSVSAVGATNPPSDHITMIVGKEPHETHYSVWTFHPGEPVRPSAIKAETMSAALSQAGIDTAALPPNGPARRIPISRQQLASINASLPEDSRMTLAKVESEHNVGQ